MFQWSWKSLQSLCSLLLRFSLIFPWFLSLKCPSNNLCYDMISLWSPQMKWPGFYRIFVLTQLASRLNSFAMASWGFFTSGFMPHQLWGVLAAIARLTSRFVRHGEIWSSSLWSCSPSTRILLAMARFLAFHTPWRVDLCTFSLFYFFAWCLEFSSCRNG